LAAQLFMAMLRFCDWLFLAKLAGYRAPAIESHPALVQQIGSHGLWLIPLVTTLGGLISGILVYGFAPEAEGHGTDAAVNAFHRLEGDIRTRVAPIKMVASAITIGSGGSAGREGPIALISAALGSLYARLVHHSEQQRRLLLLAGMAAGLSAIFRSPLGTSVFAVEVLYSNMEFEAGALLYTICSSAVAYAVNGLFVGYKPLFTVSVVPAQSLADHAWYVALGLAAGVVGTFLPVLFYGVRDLFRKLPVPVWTKPAIGGLGVGAIALWFPQVLQGGYGWIQLSIDGRVALRLLLILVVAKAAAFALTVSSGGSGGVFAPSLFVGAMLGGSFAIFAHQPPAVFVVLGMASVFGAAARVPIATMLMVTEMTGGFRLLAPAGFTVMIAYLIQGRLSSGLKYRSLYEGQVPGRRNSPANYLEHIQIALSLLGKRDLHLTDDLAHVDLLRMMRSRIQFELPGKKELTVAQVKEGSALVGQAISSLYRRLKEYEFEIITVMRREHILLPHPDTLLEANDRLLLITSPQSREPLAKFVTLLPGLEEEGEQVHADHLHP
jgi:chloride channel protein, CIC family